MLTTYTALKTVHVLAAVYWIGGNSILQVQAIRAQLSRDPARTVRLLGEIEWIGQRTFLPASLILIASAFGMVADGDLEWELWIVLGLIAWVATTITGAGFLGPETGRIGSIVEREGQDSSAAQARIRRIFTISRIDLAVLLLVIVDMVIKPT